MCTSGRGSFVTGLRQAIRISCLVMQKAEASAPHHDLKRELLIDVDNVNLQGCTIVWNTQTSVFLNPATRTPLLSASGVPFETFTYNVTLTQKPLYAWHGYAICVVV